MAKITSNQINNSAESNFPIFYDNFRRTTSMYREGISNRYAETYITASPHSNRAEIFVAEPRLQSSGPTKITRLRRGPRWIPSN